MKPIAMHFVAACALSMGAGAAFSHVTLQDQAAAAGAAYRGVLRVGHGCAGSSTTSITVTLPAGFQGAQPLLKAGWNVSTRVGPLEQPFEAHGTRYTEGVQEITWRARGPEYAVPDAFADEFVFRGTTPKKAGPLWFKVVQGCDSGRNAWVEIPAAGQDEHRLKSPAARLDVLDVQAAGGHSH
ncbi:MAG: YcnI family protein [Rhodoferax sp.]|nr:YcnI family protein [Rhodoferax sp.]